MLRGEIYNRKQATQVNNFSGMRWGTITPTDLDGLIEYHDKCFVFIELKYNGKELPYGQKLAFERLVDNLKKPAILIISTHNADCDIDIDVKNTAVTSFRMQGQWHTIQGYLRTKDLVDLFLTVEGK